MKKLNLFLIAIVFTTTAAFSQRLSFGVRGGLNVATLTVNAPPYYVNGGPNIDSKKSRTSFNAGIYGQYLLNEKMWLQAELLYSGEGVSFTNPGTEAPAHIKLNYLGVPIFLKYKVIGNLYAMAGPQISYLLSAHSIYQDGASYDVKGEHKAIAIAFVPAIGYDWKNLSINFRYQLGLSKLPTSDPNWSYTRYIDGNTKSNVFAVVLSYKII